MREIKFRAWHAGHKHAAPQMLYDEKPGDCLLWQSQGQNITHVMQYTGLKDKNGRGVYHKDVWLFHGVKYTVEWDAEYAMFYLKHPSKRATEDDNMHLFVLDQGEVIGNIYENLELLEV